MDDQKDQSANADQLSELEAAIKHFSNPEFQIEITRLFGEATDRAIEERDRRLSQQQSQSQQ